MNLPSDVFVSLAIYLMIVFVLTCSFIYLVGVNSYKDAVKCYIWLVNL